MAKNRLRVASKLSGSFVLSLLLHVIFLALLVFTFSIDRQQQKMTVNLHPEPAQKTMIHASMVDKRAVDQAFKRQAQLEQQRQQELLEDKRKAKELQLEAELARKAVEQAQQKKLELEAANKKAVQEKAKLEAAQQRMQKDLAKKQQAQKKLEQQQDQAKVAQQKIEQQKVQQQLARQQAQQQQAAALKSQQELILAEHNNFIGTEVERYTAIFKAAIEENRIISAVFTGDIRCKLRIKLLPDGEILNVSVIESSGNLAYDDMSQAAVYKTAPFPMPEDHELVGKLRDIVLSFKNGEQSADVS